MEDEGHDPPSGQDEVIVRSGDPMGLIDLGNAAHGTP